MSFIKYSPDLFIEVIELNRLSQFLDQDGFRKNIIDNSVSFGLIKTQANATFPNGKVERDVNNALGQKTVKIGAIRAIDSQGRFLVKDQTNNLPVLADNNWYWIRIKHQHSTQEKGTVSIDAAGNLVGTGTKFTSTLRGQSNFPSTIKLINSVYNTLEYEVLEVTDDNHAILVYPGLNDNDALFVSESNLTYSVVGTFTEGVAIDQEDKYPFQYDDVAVELVLETVLNTKPTYVQGTEFYLARVKVLLGELIIQDKRLEVWQTSADFEQTNLTRIENPLIGVESIKWENQFNTGDKNKVSIAWGMRSTNWGIDSSQGIVTLFGSATGGNFKTIDDFTNGDFNSWRLYTQDGKYVRVYNSIKQGGAINLYVDLLDVDSFSADGGSTFIAQELLVVPNADEITIVFKPEPTDNVGNVNETFTFPINTTVAECLVTVYKETTDTVNVLYNVQYQYKLFKQYTEYVPIASGSYLTEISFTDQGILKPSADRVTYSYTSDPIDGFIRLKISPYSFFKFKGKVDKGDIIGVHTIDGFTSGQVVELKVGRDEKYQLIKGNITLTDDVYISLSDQAAVEGNEFKFHFKAENLILGAYKIYIVDNYASGTLSIVKQFDYKDVYQMQNQENGVLVSCIYDDNGNWVASQDYDLGQPFETKIIDVPAAALSDYFDTTTGQGKVRGYFGWELHSILNAGRVPVGYGQVTDAEGTVTYAIGDTGGVQRHKLTINQMPKHRHGLEGSGSRSLSGGGWIVQNDQGTPPPADGNQDAGVAQNMAKVGGDASHPNMQPYYVTVFVKRTF